MNTEQKAREWLNAPLKADSGADIYVACSIITALLAERQSLLAAANGVMVIVNESRGVDGWHLNGDVAEWETFSEVTELEQAIAMCEDKV